MEKQKFAHLQVRQCILYLRIKFKNEMEQFLQLLPVVPRALPHRCLPNQTRKESI